MTKEQLDKAIGHRLSNEKVLCTDAWRAFKTYAFDNGMAVYPFECDGKIRTKGLYHIVGPFAPFIYSITDTK